MFKTFIKNDISNIDKPENKSYTFFLPEYLTRPDNKYVCTVLRFIRRDRVNRKTHDDTIHGVSEKFPN